MEEGRVIMNYESLGGGDFRLNLRVDSAKIRMKSGDAGRKDGESLKGGFRGGADKLRIFFDRGEKYFLFLFWSGI